MKQDTLINWLSICIGKLEKSLQMNPAIGVGLAKEALFGLQLILKDLESGGD